MSALYEAPKEPLPAHTNGTNAPDWEVPEEGSTKRTRWRFGGAATGWTISDRFDRIVPPHKRYFGRSRRTLLIAICIIFLLLLGLIIGLAVGLTKKSKYALAIVNCSHTRLLIQCRTRNLPLPDGAETFTGDLTYYDPGLGACGISSTTKDDIVSISHYTFDAVQKGSDPNQNPLCGRKIRAQRVNNGKTLSLDLTVVDRC